jgi:hypothetical protein
MGVPTPPIDITGHCSAVHNNTLYLFSPAGFQSISLTQGAQWNVLSPGVSVVGGVCVNAPNQNDAESALWIVGGTSNSTEPNFSGLQKFTYATQQWDIISPSVPVSQNRQGHGATYLNSTSSIVMYAGSQDSANSNPSSQTFLISTISPYNVLSYVSTAPPLTHPMVMPWNDTHALMIGGDNDNKGVYVFGPSGWSNLGTSLTNPIATDSTEQCAIVTGDDGSKVLEIYNLAVSPNTVSQILLFSNGQPAAPGTTVGNTPAQSAKFRKRDLTPSSWPAYNISGAPTSTRTGFQVAEAPNGLAIISGGGASNDPIEIFQQRTNSWINPASLFGSSATTTTAPTTPATPISSPPTSAISAPTSTPTNNSQAKSHSLTVLGGALGGILGFAALLIIFLLLVRWYADRKRRRAEEAAEKSEKDGRLSFADKGTPSYMRDIQGDIGYGPNTNSMVGSISSYQMFGSKSASAANNGHRRAQNSGSSTAGLVTHTAPTGETIDDLELARVNYEKISRPGTSYSHERGASAQGPLESRDRTTAGWSTYFSTNTPVTNLAAPTAAPLPAEGSFMQGPASNSSPRGLASGPPTISARSSHSTYEGGSRPTSKARPEFANAVKKTRSRAISNSSYDPHWSVLSEDRGSDTSSIMASFPPIGSAVGPTGNAFARPNHPLTAPRPASPAGSGQGISPGNFPMPKAYFPAAASPTLSGKTSYSPHVSQIPMPVTQVGAERRGPKVTRLTGNEDMSWLNINAPPGAPI